MPTTEELRKELARKIEESIYENWLVKMRLLTAIHRKMLVDMKFLHELTSLLIKYDILKSVSYEINDRDEREVRNRVETR